MQEFTLGRFSRIRFPTDLSTQTSLLGVTEIFVWVVILTTISANTTNTPKLWKQ